MAIRDFTKEVEKVLKRLQREQKGGFLPTGGIVSVEINAATMPPALVKATRSIIRATAEKQNQNSSRTNINSAPVMRFRRYNKQEVWKRLIAELADDINKIQPTTVGYELAGFGRLKPKSAKKYKRMPGLEGVMLISGAYLNTARPNLIIIDLVVGQKGKGTATPMGSDTAIRTAVKALFDDLRDEIWDKWIELIETKEGKKLEGRDGEAYNLGRSTDTGVRYSKSTGKFQENTFGKLLDAGGVIRAHKKDTTTAATALLQLEDDTPQITIGNITLNTIDIRKLVINNTTITATQNRMRSKLGAAKGTKLPTETRMYEVALKRNTPEMTDLQKMIRSSNSADSGFTGSVVNAISKLLDKEIAAGRLGEPDKATSKPFTQDVADTAVEMIADSVAGKKSLNPKILKIKKKIQDKSGGDLKQTTTVSSQKRQAIKKSSMSITTSAGVAKLAKATSASFVKRSQSGKKKNQGVTVNKLKYLVNRSLGAEIRRNMGRPALINQTGTFSNSAELVNLRETPAGYTGEYTYQMDPYSTFENEGRKQWPTGYNPKPLIAKSIRNVALRHVEGKFTLRRT